MSHSISPQPAHLHPQSLSPASKDRKKAKSTSGNGSSGIATGLGRGPASVAMAQSASGGSGSGARDGGGDEVDDGGKGGKNKDLSHVPCRFFKVGACQAGASCPFSHSAPEPGQGRQVCQWYLKGNCRFGHKCALAHLKPGEPPIMDRKNKKAAQLASQGKHAEPSSPSQPDEHAFPLPSAAKAIVSPSKQRVERSVPGSGAGGESVTIRPLAIPAGKSYSEMAKASKAVPSVRGSLSMTKPVEARPGATAQDGAGGKELQDGKIDAAPPPLSVPLESPSGDVETTPQATSTEWKRVAFVSGSSGASPYPLYLQQGSGITQTIPTSDSGSKPGSYNAHPLTVPAPMSSFRQTSFEGAQSYKAAPIGTPPNELSFPMPINASGSPFSAPGSRGIFPSSSFTDRTGIPRPPLTSGISGGYPDTSLALPAPGAKLFSSSVVGAEFGQMGRDIWGQRSFAARMPSTTSPPMAHARVRPPNDIRRYSDVFTLDDEGDVADDDDQGEEFLPSSLNELLTPRERARRLSRQDSNQKSGSVGVSMGWPQQANAQYGNPPATSVGSTSWDGRQGIDPATIRQARSAGPTTGGTAFLQGLWDDDEKPAGEGATARPLMGEQRLSASSVAFLPNLVQTGTRRAGQPPSSLLSDQQPRSSVFTSTSAGLTAHSPSRPSPLHHLTQIGVGNGAANESGHGIGAELGFVPGAGIAQGGGAGGPGNGSAGLSQGLAVQQSQPLLNQLSPLSSFVNPHAQHLQSTQTTQQASQAVPQPHPSHPSNNLLHTHNQNQSPHHLSLSPGTRALQSHAPGQSLPQGLAAGLSRLHLVPPRKFGALTGLSMSDASAESGNGVSPSWSGMGEGMVIGAGGNGVDAGVGRGQQQQPQHQQHKRSEGDEDDLFDMES